MILLTLPDVPPSLNRWTKLHWTKQRDIKTMWESIVWAAAVNAKAKDKQLKRAKIRITYYFPTRKPRDKDNYAPKFIGDGLVKAGVIADDNAGAVDMDWDFAKGEPKRTEIRIECAE